MNWNADRGVTRKTRGAPFLFLVPPSHRTLPRRLQPSSCPGVSLTGLVLDYHILDMDDTTTSSRILQESMEKPEFPSGLLGDSMQIQGTAAPFTDLASDEESQWAGGGPGRSTRESSTNEADRPSASTTPQTGRLSAILQRLGPVRSDSPERKTPQLTRNRSTASSDVSYSDEAPSKSFGSSVKNAINYGRRRLLSQDGSNVETPKAGNGNSRIPVSGGRKGRRSSLEGTPSNDKTSRPASTYDETQNGVDSGKSIREWPLCSENVF